MQARINRRRLGVVIGGAVAVLSVGVAMVAADPSTMSSASNYSMSVYQPQVAAWANANGLSGLSPAGLAVPARSFGQAEIAAWASANGFSGLSPASLAAVPLRSVDLPEIEAWARANGLSGLSPASLRSIDD